MHGRTGLHLLGALAKRIQLFSLCGVDLDIGFKDGMFVSHDEEQDWAFEVECFVEFELGN